MIRQLTFDLPAGTHLNRADFCVSPANALALATIDAWQAWPNAKMMLIGPEGAGKSHLAHIWADQVRAVLLAAPQLATLDVAALAATGAVVVEDAQTLAGDPVAEAALFHLHNLLATSGTLLITANSPARDWGLILPDLASRMQATAITHIALPDDALLSAVLAKLFADRQLAIPGYLIPYLVVRMDRSFAAARSLVDALDARALAQHRPINRAMADEILDSAISDREISNGGPPE